LPPFSRSAWAASSRSARFKMCNAVSRVMAAAANCSSNVFFGKFVLVDHSRLSSDYVVSMRFEL